jgi:excisionase family DNA binding protein
MDFITVSEAAKRLQVSVRTVRQYIYDGKLIAHRMGYRTVRISEADFNNFVMGETI